MNLIESFWRKLFAAEHKKIDEDVKVASDRLDNAVADVESGVNLLRKRSDDMRRMMRRMSEQAVDSVNKGPTK